LAHPFYRNKWFVFHVDNGTIGAITIGIEEGFTLRPKGTGQRSVGNPCGLVKIQLPAELEKKWIG